jgi:hypothetical protein
MYWCGNGCYNYIGITGGILKHGRLLGRLMKVFLATLCLNEMEHLPRLYEQHKNWPGLVEWVFVESADRYFQKVAPELVSNEGLSVDGTTEYLTSLAALDSRIRHIRFGFTEHSSDPAQGKVKARNAYLIAANEIKPDVVMVVDGDEFYSYADQAKVAGLITKYGARNAFMFRQRHIWHPASIGSNVPLFKAEVIGGYWDVVHCRCWRWLPGMHYDRNHNNPEDSEGQFLKSLMKRCDYLPDMPQCIHLGFASNLANRQAKHEYYKHRGEGKEGGRLGRMRQMYVNCRRAYETWQPGDRLPHGARIIPYTGEIPEVFKEQQNGQPESIGGVNQLQPAAEHAQSNPSVAGPINPAVENRSGG